MLKQNSGAGGNAFPYMNTASHHLKKGENMFPVKMKYRCDSVLRYENYEKVHLMAVQADGGEDYQNYSMHTPVGEMVFDITEPSMMGAFVAGCEYYLDVEIATLTSKDILAARPKEEDQAEDAQEAPEEA